MPESRVTIIRPTVRVTVLHDDDAPAQRDLPTYRCGACGQWIEGWMQLCPVCREPEVMRPERYDALHAEDDAEEGEQDDGVAGTLDAAEVIPNVRISTGDTGMDRVLGGGFRLPCVIVLGAARGTGKSTQLVKIMAAMQTKRKLLVASEETLADIKARAIRIGLGGELRNIPAIASTTMEEIENKILADDPQVVIVDSLSKIVDPRYGERDHVGNQKRIAEWFVADRKANKRVYLIVIHFNKERDFAGAEAIQHDVDVLLEMVRHGHERVLRCAEKNRCGPDTVQAFYRMTDKGLNLTGVKDTAMMEPGEADAKPKREKNPDATPPDGVEYGGANDAVNRGTKVELAMAARQTAGRATVKATRVPVAEQPAPAKAAPTDDADQPPEQWAAWFRTASIDVQAFFGALVRAIPARPVAELVALVPAAVRPSFVKQLERLASPTKRTKTSPEVREAVAAWVKQRAATPGA